MHPKLLLADDSVTIQRVIELTFADEDVQVVAVGDGQQAIDRVKSDRPDIVLADVGMPERDGYEVAAFIKGDPALAHIPVLLLTGAFEPIDEARARAVGCDGVLVKPFEPQMVISRVRDLLAGKRDPAVGRQGGHAAARANATGRNIKLSRRPRSKTISTGSTPRSRARGHRHPRLIRCPRPPRLSPWFPGRRSPPRRSAPTRCLPVRRTRRWIWAAGIHRRRQHRRNGTRGRSSSHPGHLRSNPSAPSAQRPRPAR